MDFQIERLRFSPSERNTLIRLKALTGIENWNTLARWAFCMSLDNEGDLTLNDEEPASGGIEMTWMVFAGKDYKIFQDLLIADCELRNLRVNKSNLKKVLRAHLSRGIHMIHATTKSLDDLFNYAC